MADAPEGRPAWVSKRSNQQRRRAAAVDMATSAVAAGEDLTGRELGERFGMSRRWGSDILREVGGATGSHIAAVTATAPPAPRQRPWWETAITLVVALVAAAASYGHMYEVALAAGEPLWIARGLPLTVDGLAVAGLLRGDEGRRWLILGLAVSIAANVVAQYPDVAATAAPVIAGWPPIALYGTHRLLHRGGDRG